MIVRNVQSRISRLEARSARPDEMLVVWRKPDGDVTEALKNATFAKGDMVICAEWFDSSPPPAYPCRSWGSSPRAVGIRR